jgi:hypothetical protein
MTHATDKKLRKKEKGVPHPEPLVKWPKTQLAGCKFGVRTRRATQMETEARTLMGANQRIILCRFRVVREQIIPVLTRTAMESRTVWRAELLRLARGRDWVGGKLTVRMHMPLH